MAEGLNMVAKADPGGINKAGAPKSVNYSIEAWGFVHGRYDSKRKALGWTVAIGGVIVLFVVAWLLTQFAGTNAHEVQPQQWYRAAQMSERQLTDYIHKHEIKTVLRLIGTDDGNTESYQSDTNATQKTGARLVVTKLPTSRLPHRSELASLFQALDRLAANPAERPVLVHCKHGADRTGLVTVIWLHDYQGVSFEEARGHLAFLPYGHFALGHKLDEFIGMYEDFRKDNPRVSMKQWVRDHYFIERDGRNNRAWYQ
ncbi:MAG: tyrosine-protein phosphatase [Planctomycetes bacterium]|nr:tyrosine-protein phosphatase [Planctomycetota bacterium]